MKDIWRMSAGASYNYTLTLKMFSINILRFMSDFSFKGDRPTLCVFIFVLLGKTSVDNT